MIGGTFFGGATVEYFVRFVTKQWNYVYNVYGLPGVVAAGVCIVVFVIMAFVLLDRRR